MDPEADKEKTVIKALEQGKFIKKGVDVARQFVKNQETLLTKENIEKMSKGALMIVIENDLDQKKLVEYQAKLGLNVEKLKMDDLDKNK